MSLQASFKKFEIDALGLSQFIKEKTPPNKQRAVLIWQVRVVEAEPKKGFLSEIAYLVGRPRLRTTLPSKTVVEDTLFSYRVEKLCKMLMLLIENESRVF